MSSREALDFNSQSTSFIPVDVQARYLVDHLISSGVCWGRIYREARLKSWLAAHGSPQEKWYDAILNELRLRIVGAALAGIP
ncbi:hypothetical protein VTH82DRAFT_1431 [Thermothelomyces myriococcoides]